MRLILLFLFGMLFLQTLQAQCLSGDCVNGKGVLTSPAGWRYEGDFKDGHRTGSGTCTFPDKSRFVGSWLNDLPHGRGRRYTATGAFTDGVWENGRLLMIMDTPDGEYVEQTPLEADASPAEIMQQAVKETDPRCKKGDCMEGAGEYVFDNGDRYVGQFHGGRRQGKGSYFYTNGDRYIGVFDQDHFQGEGTYYNVDGTATRGLWHEDAWLGEVPEDDDIWQPANPTNMKSWAVIVGVTKYTAMSPLNFTDDDARLLAAFLRSPEGGGLDDEHLKLLIDEDATYLNITTVLAETFEKAGPDDLIVFYFSGHGLPGYFLPIDYDGKRNMLPHGVVNTLLLDSPAKYKLCLADACHSGSLIPQGLTRSKADQTVRKFYNSFKDIRAGVALIMSSRGEEYSLESQGLKQGLFSHFLIEGLRGWCDNDNDKVVTITELFEYVKTNVVEYSAGFQNPVISGNYDPKMPVGVVGE